MKLIWWSVSDVSRKNKLLSGLEHWAVSCTAEPQGSNASLKICFILDCENVCKDVRSRSWNQLIKAGKCFMNWIIIQSTVDFVLQSAPFRPDLLSLCSSKNLDVLLRNSKVEAELLTLVGRWSSFFLCFGARKGRRFGSCTTPAFQLEPNSPIWWDCDRWPEPSASQQQRKGYSSLPEASISCLLRQRNWC